MSSIGPELPPHLIAKRKRQAEAEQQEREEEASASKTSKSSTPESDSKRRRVVGPAPPPASLDETPSTAPDGDDASSSDDEYGPSLPRTDGASSDAPTRSVFDQEADSEPAQPKPMQRDEWMMVPPKQDDLAQRLDPTKLRARKFNTGKGARGPNQAGGDNAIWTETPEQKRKRLEDEVLGKAESGASSSKDKAKTKPSAEDEEKARRIKEYNDKHRNKSLYDTHQGSTHKRKEDDPSQRAFDYDKDMGGGAKIGHAQRREMLNRAADFGSRFSSGKYL